TPQIPEISGIEPSIPYRFLSGRRIVVIPFHQDRATDADFTNAIAVGGINPDVDPADRLTHRSDDIRTPWRRGRGCSSFRQSIGLKHGVSEPIQISCDDRIEARPPACQHTQIRTHGLMNPPEKLSSRLRVSNVAGNAEQDSKQFSKNPGLRPNLRKNSFVQHIEKLRHAYKEGDAMFVKRLDDALRRDTRQKDYRGADTQWSESIGHK